jgi:hypothetical protein
VGSKLRVQAKAAFAANARTNASRLVVFSRLVVHDGLCVKPLQRLGDQIVAAAAATQPEFPRRATFTTRVPPSAAVARERSLDPSSGPPLPPPPPQKACVLVCEAATACYITSGNSPEWTRAARARAVPTLPQSTEPPSSSLAAFKTALAAFLAAGAKTATLSNTLSYKAKRH